MLLLVLLKGKKATCVDQKCKNPNTIFLVQFLVIAIKKISISFRLETWWTRKWDVKQMNSWSRWGLKSIKKDNTFRCNMQLVARSESTGSPDLDQRQQLGPYKAWLNFDW